MCGVNKGKLVSRTSSMNVSTRSVFIIMFPHITRCYRYARCGDAVGFECGGLEKIRCFGICICCASERSHLFQVTLSDAGLLLNVRFD